MRLRLHINCENIHSTIVTQLIFFLKYVGIFVGIKHKHLHKLSKKGVNTMKTTTTLSDVRSKVSDLKGKNIALKINKGRNKIVSLTAIIDQVYPSMFVISPTSEVILDRKSYSYSDVLCGDVKFID